MTTAACGFGISVNFNAVLRFFIIFYAVLRFSDLPYAPLLWVFQGNTEEMKYGSLAVSRIIPVFALVKTTLKSTCAKLTSWLLRCND